MNHSATIGMNYRYRPADPSRRLKGLVIVVALHAFLGYALLSGLARNGLSFMKKPLEAVVIQDVIIPPPPPPPKEIKKTPQIKDETPPPFVPPPDIPSTGGGSGMVIASSALPPQAPVVIAPPAPPPPPKPAANRNDIKVACPTQIPPQMPRKALQDGTEGVVKAQITIKGGVIQDVTILSGPRVFHAAVKEAMLQYKCVSDAGGEVVATQEFNFKIE